MTAASIGTVAIIGAGIMGTGLAAEWSAAGRNVTLYARDAQRAAASRERVAAALRTLERGGLLDAATAQAAGQRVTATSDLAAAVAGADLVQESIPENLDLKRALFAELDQQCPPSTVLATNTSGLPITQIAAGLAGANRIIGMHYLNPPHLMPPVEVIPGEQTDPAVVERVRTVLTALGKSPLVVKREVPGFLWNRLQFALAREAFWLVEHGVATLEEVDLAMRQGLGRRWSIAGPFASLDLGGLDTMAKIADYLFPALSAEQAAPPLLTEQVAIGHFGAKTGSGFYDWSPERIAATVARRDALLLAALRQDRLEQQGEENRHHEAR